MLSLAMASADSMMGVAVVIEVKRRMRKAMRARWKGKRSILVVGVCFLMVVRVVVGS